MPKILRNAKSIIGFYFDRIGAVILERSLSFFQLPRLRDFMMCENAASYLFIKISGQKVVR